MDQPNTTREGSVPLAESVTSQGLPSSGKRWSPGITGWNPSPNSSGLVSPPRVAPLGAPDPRPMGLDTSFASTKSSKLGPSKASVTVALTPLPNREADDDDSGLASLTESDQFAETHEPPLAVPQAGLSMLPPMGRALPPATTREAPSLPTPVEPKGNTPSTYESVPGFLSNSFVPPSAMGAKTAEQRSASKVQWNLAMARASRAAKPSSGQTSLYPASDDAGGHPMIASEERRGEWTTPTALVIPPVASVNQAPTDHSRAGVAVSRSRPAPQEAKPVIPTCRAVGGPCLFVVAISIAACFEWASLVVGTALLQSPIVIPPQDGSLPALPLMILMMLGLTFSTLLASCIDRRYCKCCHSPASARGASLPPWAAQPSCCVPPDLLSAVTKKRRRRYVTSANAAGKLVNRQIQEILQQSKESPASLKGCCSQCCVATTGTSPVKRRQDTPCCALPCASDRRSPPGVLQACGFACGMPAAPLWLVVLSACLEAVGYGLWVSNMRALPAGGLPVIALGGLTLTRVAASSCRGRGSAQTTVWRVCCDRRNTGVTAALLGALLVLATPLVSHYEEKLTNVIGIVIGCVLIAGASAIREVAMGRNAAPSGTCGDPLPNQKQEKDKEDESKYRYYDDDDDDDDDEEDMKRKHHHQHPAKRTKIGPQQPPDPLATWQVHGAVAITRLVLVTLAIPILAQEMKSAGESSGDSVSTTFAQLGAMFSCVVGFSDHSRRDETILIESCQGVGPGVAVVWVLSMTAGAMLSAHVADVTLLARAQSRRAFRRAFHRRSLALNVAKQAEEQRSTSTTTQAEAARRRRGMTSLQAKPAPRRRGLPRPVKVVVPTASHASPTGSVASVESHVLDLAVPATRLPLCARGNCCLLAHCFGISDWDMVPAPSMSPFWRGVPVPPTPAEASKLVTEHSAIAAATAWTHLPAISAASSLVVSSLACSMVASIMVKIPWVPQSFSSWATDDNSAMPLLVLLGLGFASVGTFLLFLPPTPYSLAFTELSHSSGSDQGTETVGGLGSNATNRSFSDWWESQNCVGHAGAAVGLDTEWLTPVPLPASELLDVASEMR
jgi:hypothetical protein